VLGLDREAEHDGREPTLGWTVSGGNDDREQGCDTKGRAMRTRAERVVKRANTPELATAYRNARAPERNGHFWR
jgi:hypothetical protein